MIAAGAENPEQTTSPPERILPMNVVFRPTKMFDNAIRSIVRNPNGLINFSKIFIDPPYIPEEMFGARAPRIELHPPRLPRPSTADLPALKVNGSVLPRPGSRPILTPKWNQYKTSTTHFSTSNLMAESIPSFIEMHQPLEIGEYRIANGIDRIHFHSGQILDKNIKLTDLTEEEVEKKANYNRSALPNKIPDNWEPRPWDKPDRILSNQESNELKYRINQAYTRAQDPENWFTKKKRKTSRKYREESEKDIYTPSSTNRSTRVRHIRKAIVRLSEIVYATDDSADDTDWADFDL